MDLDRLRYYTRWHRHANDRTYEAPADPWKLLPVDPGEIEWCTGELALNWGLGRVQSGSWDRNENCRRVRETTTFRGLRQRFDEGLDWEETALYRRVKERFENGESVREYDSPAAFRNARCEYLDELFHRIKTEGYRPNEAAAHDNPHADGNPFEDAYVHHLEPLVAIGRDGTIVWTEGYHRFAIASILDIDEIPVQVLCRHERWQQRRDRLAEARGTPPPELEQYLDHPDLADLGQD